MKFIFDENLSPKLARGLKEFGEETSHLRDYFAEGTSDEEWLRRIGEEGWTLITLDKRIRRRPIERDALKNYKVGAFFLGGKTMRRWDYVKQIVRAWENIKHLAESETPPFAYQINTYGTKIEKLSLD